MKPAWADQGSDPAVQLVGAEAEIATGNPADVLILGDAELAEPVDEFLTEEDVEPSWGDQMLAIGGVAFESPAHAARAYPQLWPSANAARMALAREVKSTRTNPYRDYPISKCSDAFQADYQLAGNGEHLKRAVVLSQGGEARALIESLLGLVVPLAFFQVEEPEPDGEVATAVAESAEPVEPLPIPGGFKGGGFGLLPAAGKKFSPRALSAIERSAHSIPSRKRPRWS